MIHCESPDNVYKKENVPFWLLSAFKAGFINSAGFLMAGEFVSHITGFGSRVGISLGHHSYFFGIELLMLPFSFILGGVITSLLLDRDYQQNKVPPYYQVQGLITLLIAIVLVFGELGFISNQESFSSDNHYSLLELFIVSLLCFICGLKNSMVAWTTYGKVRVTHLTGLATDIGLNFVRMFNPHHPNPRFKEKPFVNWMRICLLITFFLGAMISAVAFPYLGYRTFIIVFILSLGMTIVSLKRATQFKFSGLAHRA